MGESSVIELFDVLEYEEDFREKPYYCTEGYPTIGIGTKIGTKGAPLELFTLTVSRQVAELMLEDEVSSFSGKLENLDWFVGLDRDRQVIIESMCYQMGYSGVMKFKKMIAALSTKNWLEASKQALDSKWAKQTPDRAGRHSEVLLGGSLNFIYGDLV